MGYTLAQIEGYLAAVERAERQRIGATAVAMRMAQQADNTAFDTFLECFE